MYFKNLNKYILIQKIKKVKNKQFTNINKY